MICVSPSKTRSERIARFVIAAGVVLLVFGTATAAVREGSAEHYKMISVVEYTGQGQFRNQVETLFTVRKENLSDNEVRYTLSGNDLNPNVTEEVSLMRLSFILDKDTGHMSASSEEMAFWARVNNESVKWLEEVTKENVGKTWKQSIHLSSLGDSLPGELAFTLAAIELKRFVGQMIAVRALSEPFVVETPEGPLRSKINTVYLFDPEIEDVYLSVSVFETTKDVNGVQETLRHEVATYRADAVGKSVDLSGLGPKFERFVRKVGLSRNSVKVVEEVPLPQWAQSEGLAAAQVANMCAAMACEGAPNPVVTVCVPVARIVAMQGLGEIPSIGTFAMAETVAGSLVQTVPGIGTMKIAMAPALLGANWATAGIIAGGTAGGVAVGGGFSSGGGSSSIPIASPQ